MHVKVSVCPIILHLKLASIDFMKPSLILAMRDFCRISMSKRSQHLCVQQCAILGQDGESGLQSAYSAGMETVWKPRFRVFLLKS